MTPGNIMDVYQNKTIVNLTITKSDIIWSERQHNIIVIKKTLTYID